MKKKLVIIGGGISGLSLAFLAYNDYDVTLLEAKDRLGGKIYGTFKNDKYYEHSLRTFNGNYLALKYIMKQLKSTKDENKNLLHYLKKTGGSKIDFNTIKLYYLFFTLSDYEIENLKKITFEEWLNTKYKNKEDIKKIISTAGILVAARGYSSAYEIYSMFYLILGGNTQPTYNYNEFLIDPLEKKLKENITIKKNSKVTKLIYDKTNNIKEVILSNKEVIKGDIFVIATYKDDMFKLYDLPENEKNRWHTEVSIAFHIVIDNSSEELPHEIIRNNYNSEILSPWDLVWYPYCINTWYDDDYFKNNNNIVILSIVVSNVNKEGNFIKKKLIDCTREEVFIELMNQTNIDKNLIERLAIPDENKNILRFGNNISYTDGKWSFTDKLTINKPNKESLDANTNIKNLFLAGEHVKSHLWEIPTMEQACESAFECFKKIEESENREFIIPYEQNINNLLPNYVKFLRSFALMFKNNDKKGRNISNNELHIVTKIMIFIVTYLIKLFLFLYKI